MKCILIRIIFNHTDTYEEASSWIIGSLNEQSAVTNFDFNDPDEESVLADISSLSRAHETDVNVMQHFSEAAAPLSQPLCSPRPTFMSPSPHSYQSRNLSLPSVPPLSTSGQQFSSGSSLESHMQPLAPTFCQLTSGVHQSASTSQQLSLLGQSLLSPSLHSYRSGTLSSGGLPLSTGQSLMPHIQPFTRETYSSNSDDGHLASLNQQPFSSRQAMLSNTGDNNLM